jgi:hypothetical protein
MSKVRDWVSGGEKCCDALYLLMARRDTCGWLDPVAFDPERHLAPVTILSFEKAALAVILAAGRSLAPAAEVAVGGKYYDHLIPA